MVEYNANGTLNPLFDDDGIYYNETSGMDNTFSEVVIGSDQKITVAGFQRLASYNTLFGQSIGTNFDFTLQRFVGNSANIQAISATTSGGAKISVTYNITGGPIKPFYIGSYFSPNKTATGNSGLGNTLVGRGYVYKPADLASGPHTLQFDINAFGLMLPGYGFLPEDLLDQYLLVVFDDDNRIGETDASPFNQDNTIVFNDVYHIPGGPVVAFGSDADDSMVITTSGTNLRLNRNGIIHTYAAATVSQFVLRGAGGNDTLTATNVAKSVVLIGGAGNDLLTGGSQNDRLDGGQGNDTLRGGNGDDSYIFDKVLGAAEIDTVIEVLEQGNDLLDFSKLAAADAVNVDLQNGSALANHTGRTVKTSVAAQALQFEQVTGGAGGDTIRGNHRNNILVGGAGNDTLDGRDGDDTLEGGSGNDSLTGGIGNDIYVFKTANTAEVDTIFELLGGGIDTLDFSALLTAVNVNLSSTTTTLATHSKRKVLVGTAGDSAFLENALAVRVTIYYAAMLPTITCSEVPVTMLSMDSRVSTRWTVLMEMTRH